jgi:rubrerythrin
MSINIKEVQPLHIFSEVSHYVCEKNDGKNVKMKHLASGQIVNLTAGYVEKFLRTADQFTKVVKVGKEDKFWTAKQIDEAITKKEFTKENAPLVGDVRVKGIRTLWEEIHSTQVLAVCYQKQGAKHTKKDYEAARQKQRDEATALIEKAKTSKKSMADAYKAALELVQNNPISEYKDGELRTLRGYKVQFTSRDGKYNCVDIDLPESDTAKRIRPVNINTISWLVFDGVKYEVE